MSYIITAHRAEGSSRSSSYASDTQTIAGETRIETQT
jgi:hypothetical protein